MHYNMINKEYLVAGLVYQKYTYTLLQSPAKKSRILFANVNSIFLLF